MRSAASGTAERWASALAPAPPPPNRDPGLEPPEAAASAHGAVGKVSGCRALIEDGDRSLLPCVERFLNVPICSKDELLRRGEVKEWLCSREGDPAPEARLSGLLPCLLVPNRLPAPGVLGALLA